MWRARCKAVGDKVMELLAPLAAETLAVRQLARKGRVAPVRWMKWTTLWSMKMATASRHRKSMRHTPVCHIAFTNESFVAVHLFHICLNSLNACSNENCVCFIFIAGNCGVLLLSSVQSVR
jgi:hypothetical protein